MRSHLLPPLQAQKPDIFLAQILGHKLLGPVLTLSVKPHFSET